MREGGRRERERGAPAEGVREKGQEKRGREEKE